MGVNDFALALKASGFAGVVVTGYDEHGQAPQKADDIIHFDARRPAEGAETEEPAVAR